MNIKESLEVLKDLREMASTCQEFEVKELDSEALDFAINYIEKTAQEGQVQEQLQTKKVNEYISLSDAEIISKDILKILSKYNLNYSIANEILDLCSNELQKNCFIKI